MLTVEAFGVFDVFHRRTGEHLASLELPIGVEERRKAFAVWCQECEDIAWADALRVYGRVRFVRCG